MWSDIQLDLDTDGYICKYLGTRECTWVIMHACISVLQQLRRQRKNNPAGNRFLDFGSRSPIKATRICGKMASPTNRGSECAKWAACNAVKYENVQATSAKAHADWGMPKWQRRHLTVFRGPWWIVLGYMAHHTWAFADISRLKRNGRKQTGLPCKTTPSHWGGCLIVFEINIIPQSFKCELASVGCNMKLGQ